jgi:hypothetical protein
VPDDPRTATTLAYVGASKRVSSRLSNLFHHIYPDMLGVWLMGSDRSDRERVLFGRGVSVVGAVAEFPALKIEAESDVELVAAWIARDNAAGDELNVQLLAGPNGGAGWTETVAGFATEDGEAGARVYSALPAIVFAVGVPVHHVGNTSFLVPGLPTVLRAGRAFEIASLTDATTLRGGFMWRVLG